MAYSVIQSPAENSVDNTNLSSIVNAVFGSSVTAANALLVFVGYGAASARTVALTRGSDVFTQCGTGIYNGGFSFGLRAFVCDNAGAGTTAVSCAFSGGGGTVDSPAIAAIELSGIALTPNAATPGSAEQDSPGTGANALTSGNTGALSAQPAAVFGICWDFLGGTPTAPTAGTGFTGLTPVWEYGTATSAARIEHKRVTATTAVPATYTAVVGGDSYLMLTVALLEGGGGGGGGTPLLNGNNTSGGMVDMSGGMYCQPNRILVPKTRIFVPGMTRRAPRQPTLSQR